MIATKENSLIVELRTFAKLIGEEGRQAEFYRQMLQDAKPMELVLDRDPTKEEYMALGEYDQETVVSICSEVGFYGSVYPIIYNKQKTEK